MSNEIMLTNVRLSFPVLVEPKAFQEGQKKKYSADFILEPDSPGFKEFHKVALKMATEKWKDKTSAVMEVINNDSKLRCFGEGKDKVNKKTFEPYDGYGGNLYISANSENQPQMVNVDGSPVDRNNTMAAQEIARSLYGGCHVNVAIRPWLQDNQFGRAIRCELVAIQFLKDDEAFGEGSTDVSGMFGAVESGGNDSAFAADDMPAFLS